MLYETLSTPLPGRRFDLGLDGKRDLVRVIQTTRLFGALQPVVFSQSKTAGLIRRIFQTVK